MKPLSYLLLGILSLCLSCQKEAQVTQQESLRAFAKPTHVPERTLLTGRVISAYDMEDLYFEYTPATVSTKPRSFYFVWEVPYTFPDGYATTLSMRDVITVHAYARSVIIHPDAVADFTGQKPVVSAYRMIPLKKVTDNIMEVLNGNEFDPKYAVDPSPVSLLKQK